jgi:hypothetical protein
MYGLGSFVKKAVRKVTKPFTKVAKKIVPKEVAGIMRAAAPFLPAGYREAAYLLGTAKQTGRISPIDLALAAAPTIGKIETSTGQTIGQRLGALNVPFTDRSLGDVLVGTTKVAEGADPGTIQTSGIFGKGGEMFQLGKGTLPGTGAKQNFGVLDTKAGQFLLGGEDDKFSKAKLAGVGVGVLSLIQNSKTADDAGKALAASTGNSDDYDRGYALFSQLKPELFEVPEKFRMSVNVKDGGRIGFNEGTPKSTRPMTKQTLKDLAGLGLGSLDEMSDRPFKFDAQQFMIDQYNEKGIQPEIIGSGFQGDDNIFIIRTPNGGTMSITLDQYLSNFGSPEIKEMKADGGIMRTNYARGSDDDDDKPVLPEDPTKPINPFGPKPIKPLGDMKMAGSDRYQRILEQLINELEDRLGRELTNEEYDMVGKMAYDKLSDPDFAVGGRVDYALGTKPTAEESGLGGLPIEADMRYTGGFMPYGAKEKADDVPARLSKNEFVFTADAVRAAGGGSVNEGAKKMYATMKQLEAKPEAKGMTA